jgi:hypothetical protein
VREIAHPHRLGNVPASNLARQTLDYLSNTGPTTSRGRCCSRAGSRARTSAPGRSSSAATSLGGKGRKFTAEDVVWNIRSVLDPQGRLVGCSA